MSGFVASQLTLDSENFATSSGDNNNIQVMGSLVYVTVSNDMDAITGITHENTGDGSVVYLANVTSNKSFLIKNNNASSSAWNRIITYGSQDIMVAPGIAAILRYDTITQFWYVISLLTRPRSFTNNASHSIVTTAASANGFQLSATRDVLVNYSVTVSTTVQIGVGTNVSGYVLLEIAATNSSTAGDWQEIARTGNGQNIGLALALSSAQTTPAQIGGVIPAGYYGRLRSVNANGTPTYAYNSGQEVLL